MEASLRNAHDVQMALLPEHRPDLPGYEFWDAYEPALSVGGDYYDYFPLRNEAQGGPLWAISLGDVSGKGMPAALLVAKLSAELRVCLLTEPHPVRAIEKLNRQLCDARFPERFITFLCVRLDGDTHRLTIVNAGHMGPLIRRASGLIEVIGEEDGGPPLAIIDGVHYASTETVLEKGAVVVLYTGRASTRRWTRRTTSSITMAFIAPWSPPLGALAAWERRSCTPSASTPPEAPRATTSASSASGGSEDRPRILGLATG